MSIPTNSMPPHISDAQRLQIAIHWLAYSGKLNMLSILGTLGSIGFWLLPQYVATANTCMQWLCSLGIMVSMLCGLLQAFYALRVHFDQRVFLQWLHHIETPPNCTIDTELHAFDTIITDMGLRPMNYKGSSTQCLPLKERIRGACRLFRNQGLALIAQYACLLAVFLIR